ncbi:MAG: PDGLE domain-containing protein [Actinomycetales bacterium]|nr:PDGLE domain-containing protein [Actinomycetales bacterium]
MSHSPDVSTTTTRAGRTWWVLGLGVALFVAGVISRFASSAPDGLERVTEDHGIAEQAVGSVGLLSYGGATTLLGLGLVLVLTSALSWAVRTRGR